MLGLGLSLQKGISAFNAGRALVSSYIRRVTEAGGVLQNTACDAAAINELNQDRLLEPASWVLVPDGIEEDIVFAQKPTSGLGDLTFTRASDATYTDSTGVVRRSPYNLLTFSEDFSNAAWSKSAASISSNVTTAPNGTLTADKLVEDTANASHTLFQNISISASTSYNYSVYLKSAERFRFRVRFTGFSGAQDATVNLNTQTTSLGTLTSVGNGWFRFAWSVNSGAGGSSTLVAITLQDDSGNSTYLGNGTSGAFLWGAQLVEGTSALDYFPTTNRQDVPRIDFRNADGTLSSCGRLLLEPQRTNSFLNSLLVGGIPPTSWSRPLTGGTVTAVSSIYGNGDGATALQFVVSNASDCIESNGISFVSGNTTTITVYIESITGNIQASNFLRITGSKTGTETYKINGQTITSTTNITAGLFELNFAATGNSINSVRMGAGNQSINVTATLRISRPQAEVGAYPTTRIPTTTAAVTRIADAASKTGVSSLIGQTEGTLFAEVNISNFDTADQGILNIIQNSNNRMGLAMYRSGATNFLQFYQIFASSVQVNINSTVTAGRYKIAGAYKLNDFVLYINGVQIGVDTSASVPTASEIAVGVSTGGTIPFGNRVDQAALFPTRLSNDQLEVLTSEGYGTYALLAQSLNCVLQ